MSEFGDYCLDIWYCGGGDGIRVVEWEWIDAETYGNLYLWGNQYFRYDKTFATEKITNLIYASKNGNIQIFNTGGQAQFGDGYDFTVLMSAYDMTYYAEADMTMGHTYKNYYFYYDKNDRTAYEYTADEISADEFLGYKGAVGVIDTITDEMRLIYREKQIDNVDIEFTFLKRKCGYRTLIHININCIYDDCTDYHYKTYIYDEYDDDNQLGLLDSGIGYYLAAGYPDLTYIP
jgi:hypothetical protein